MVRTTFYLFLFLLPQLTFAQYQLDSLVVQNDSITNVVRQHFDSEKNQLQTVSYHKDREHNAIAWQSMKLVQYDQHNNVVLRIENVWDTTSNSWNASTKVNRSYDGQNRMSSYATYTWEDERWNGVDSSQTSYMDQKVTTVDFVGVGGDWMPNQQEIAQFSAENDELYRIRLDWDSIVGAWRNQEKEEYKYHRENVVSEYVTSTWDGAQWVNKEKITYEYNMPDSTTLTDQWLYVASDTGWTNTQRTVISYYDSARRNEIFSWDEEEQGWLRETLSETYFDRHGRETDFLYKSAKYHVHFQRMTIFDEKGRITLSQEIGYDGNKSAFGTQTVFEFDEDGNLIRETEKYLKVEEGIWLIGEERRYEYDLDIELRAADGSINLHDRDNIGLANMRSNKHAVTAVRTYRMEDGDLTLQELARYYYSELIK